MFVRTIISTTNYNWGFSFALQLLGFGIRSITKSEGLAALWRGWKVAWIQTTLGHMSNIPLFFGWMPFRVLNEAGFVLILCVALHGRSLPTVFYPATRRLVLDATTDASPFLFALVGL